MTAALYDEVSVAPVRQLRVVRDASPAQAPAAAQAPKKVSQAKSILPFGAGSDPLVDGAARVLTVPLRHVYAALWRAGILEVRASS